jgi:hypothetical protein
MKRLAIALIALLPLAAAPPAWAGSKTLREKWEKALLKHVNSAAPHETFENPKRLCLCTGSDIRVGTVTLAASVGTAPIRLLCQVPIFNAQGDQVSQDPCDDFELLR